MRVSEACVRCSVEEMVDLQCATMRSKSQVLLGGLQQSLLSVDITSQRVVDNVSAHVR